MPKPRPAPDFLTWRNETRRLSDLVPWPKNPRQIKDRNVRLLQQSLEEFNQVEMIAIGPADETGQHPVYNGHQRLKAWGAKYGPDLEVDVRVASRPLSEHEREKLTVLLHRGGAGEWDFEALANGFDFDELVEWGFSESELVGFDFGHEQPVGDDPGADLDKAAELQAKWNVQSGQLWIMKDHRLICGDCTDPTVVARVMGGEKAGCCVTDPPYGINREGITNDNPDGLRTLFDGCLAVMPITDGVMIAFQSPRLFPSWLAAVQTARYKFERMLWLYMPVKFPSFSWHGWYLRSDCICVSSIGTAVYIDAEPYQHDTYTVQHENELSNGWHASVKPIAVVSDLVQRVGGTVYDPFSGSGTTLIACEHLNRRCRACEIEPKYCAVALQRFFDMTGVQPVLLERA